MSKKCPVLILVTAVTVLFIISNTVSAEDSQLIANQGLVAPAEASQTSENTDQAVVGNLVAEPLIRTEATPDKFASTPGITREDTELKYTLGPDDIILIEVMRHPEFGGTYTINSEGKIQYKFVGDIVAEGYTRNEFKDKLSKVLSQYIVEPDIEVTIVEYRSKVFYVVGEVGRPGRYYMMADSIPIREAVVQAGLPTLASAMRRSKLITPDEKGKAKKKNIDLYNILYEGDLRQNVDMKSGDVLYVPATLFAKIMRVISPVAAPVGPAQTIESTASGNTIGSSMRRSR